jgi:hypothetical protein
MKENVSTIIGKILHETKCTIKDMKKAVKQIIWKN